MSYTPHPLRIQRKRIKGWKMPEGAVYVGRPTMYGNPFLVGVHGDADECAEKFRRLLNSFPSPEALEEWRNAGGDATWWVCLAGRVEWTIDRIRGKQLACWCPLDKPCHADVLCGLANAQATATPKELPVPETSEKSGRTVLRLPKSLHASLALEASRQGVSLNQLIVSKLSVPLCELVQFRFAVR